MPVVQSPSPIWDEVSELMASSPSSTELLNFRPSAATQQRARELLDKLGSGTASWDEERELDQFEQAELLMRLVKAKLHAQGQA